MTSVVAVVHRERRSLLPRDDVWARIATVPRIAEAMPAVRTCVRNGERWRWEFGRYGALGLEVTPAFDVEAAFTPPEEVRFRPVGEVSEDATGRGIVTLHQRAGGTLVEVDVRVEVDVPIPGLLARPLTKVIQHEIRVVLDEFLARVCREAPSS